MELEAHPLAEVFPMMSAAEYAGLVADIKAHGLFDPIVLYEGKILDGRNRYQACHEANVAVQSVDYEGDDPLALVVAHNLNRRQLSESQRAMVGARIANLKREDTLKRGPVRTVVLSGQTAEAVAGQLGISSKSIQRARTVIEEGVRELQEAVERGEVSVRTAAIVAQLPREEQSQVVEEGPRAVADRAKAARAKTSIRPGHGRRDRAKPYEFNGERTIQIANKAHERFGIVMGGLSGYCDGMETFDVKAALAVARDGEVDEWLTILAAVARMAKKLQSELKEGQ